MIPHPYIIELLSKERIIQWEQQLHTEAQLRESGEDVEGSEESSVLKASAYRRLLHFIRAFLIKKEGM